MNINRRLSRFALPVLLGALTLVSCKKDTAKAATDELVATSATSEVYQLDTAISSVQWSGYKVFQSKLTSHFGNIKFLKGKLAVEKNQLTSGVFQVDMNSLTNEDLSDEKLKTQLIEHLKSKDFFEVEKYPTAKFEIKKVQKNEWGDYNTILEGELTIKDKTQPIAINANVNINDSLVTIHTERTDLDREDFGIDYSGDEAKGIIENKMTIQVNISATRR